MSELSNLADRLGAVKLGELLHDWRSIAAPRPGVVRLIAERATALFQFHPEEQEKKQRVSDGVLCAVADAIGTLRAQYSLPSGASFHKVSMTCTYLTRPSPATGELRMQCETMIDWQTAGEQVLTIEGFDGRDLPLFTATMTIQVVPAAG